MCPYTIRYKKHISSGDICGGNTNNLVPARPNFPENPWVHLTHAFAFMNLLFARDCHGRIQLVPDCCEIGDNLSEKNLSLGSIGALRIPGISCQLQLQTFFALRRILSTLWPGGLDCSLQICKKISCVHKPETNDTAKSAAFLSGVPHSKRVYPCFMGESFRIKLFFSWITIGLKKTFEPFDHNLLSTMHLWKKIMQLFPILSFSLAKLWFEIIASSQLKSKKIKIIQTR